MLNQTKDHLQAKYKRAQAALLNLQAEALEIKADKKFSNLADNLQESYNTSLSQSEEFLDEVKNKGEEVALGMIETIENQTYSLHTELQSVKKKIKSN